MKDIRDYAYVQLATDGKFDIISLRNGRIVDSLSNIDHLKFTNDLINLEENGYSKNQKA